MAGKRLYRPGSRDPKYNGEGRLRENVIAYLSTFIGKFSIEVYEPITTEDGYSEVRVESGNNVRLAICAVNGRTYRYNFSALTHDELVNLKQLFDMLFDEVEPIVLARDREAQDAYENGDDSFARVYRSVPRLVVRKRSIGVDSQGLLRGPEGNAEGHEVGVDSDGLPRGDGGDMADDNEG